MGWAMTVNGRLYEGPCLADAHAQFPRAPPREYDSRARSLLLGAVDTVLALANAGARPQEESSSSMPGPSLLWRVISAKIQTQFYC